METNDSFNNKLKELNRFANDCETSINEMVNELGFDSFKTIEHFANAEVVMCPFNNGHRMPKSSLEKHLEKCQFKSKGYSDDEIKKVVPNSSFYYENCANIKPIIIDKECHQKILGISLDVPLCNDRCCVELSPQQRLAVYDYVISSRDANPRPLSQSEKIDSILSADLFDTFKRGESSRDSQPPLNKLEMISLQRDMKRRSQSYRGKNVHVSRKSYTEIVREVIANHCERSFDCQFSAASQMSGSNNGNDINDIHESSDNKKRNRYKHDKDKHNTKKSRH